MSKIDVGVGKEFPVETDEEIRERERRERDEREAKAREESEVRSEDRGRDYGCGDWRDWDAQGRDWREMRDYYRQRRREWRRRWRDERGHHGGHFYFPRFIWIAAGVALIILASKVPMFVIAIIALAALYYAARKYGFLQEIARDFREGWDRDDSSGGPQPPQTPNAPSAPATSSASTTRSGGATSSGSTTPNTQSSTGFGESAGTQS